MAYYSPAGVFWGHTTPRPQFGLTDVGGVGEDAARI